jgi:membrane protein YqaA with SNARE-associated domain
VLEWAAQLLAAVAYGALSAVMPVFNSEAYVLGVTVTGVLDPVPAALGVAAGHTVGKVALLWSIRHRPGRTVRRSAPEPVQVDTRLGRTRQRLRRTGSRMLALVGDARYGLPVTFVAATVGVPPLYAVTLIAGASRIAIPAFAATVFVGRVIRFVTIALGVSLI